MTEFIFLTDVPQMKDILKQRNVEIIGSFYEKGFEHIIIENSQRHKVYQFMQELKENNK